MSKTKTISKILRLKDNRKKELEIDVKEASESVDAELSKLLTLEKEYLEALGWFNKKYTEGSLDTNDINSFHNYFLRINSKINAQKKNHLQKQEELASLRNTLVDAYKDKKMFEILNCRAAKKESRNKITSEKKESDFLSVSRHPIRKDV